MFDTVSAFEECK